MILTRDHQAVIHLETIFMSELGHIAYYVRNLERSVTFYQKVVGLNVVARIFNGRAAVLSGGSSHHELLLIQVSTGDGPLVGRRIGLYHAGWKVGASLDDLRAALDRAQLHGIPVEGTANHQVMFSLYLRDPDDNEVELFVDNPSHDWRQDSSWMEAPVQPLDLSRLQPYEKQPQPVTVSNGQSPANAAPVTAVAAVPNTANLQNTPVETTPTVEASPIHNVKNAVDSPPTGDANGDEQYDDIEDPDSLSYWLKAAAPNQATGSQTPAPEEVYDGLDDPDDIEYWLKNTSPVGTAVALANEEQNNGEVYDELEDPDDIEYWLKTIQTPSRNVSQQEEPGEELYDALEDPDALEYWLKTAAPSQSSPSSGASEALPKAVPKNPQPYDELQEPGTAVNRPAKTAA
jgi:catechol 2,3-dioxygenase